MFQIEDKEVGGVVIVWDSTKAKSLKIKELKHRWVICHHDDRLTSPGGLSYKTKAQAIGQAKLMAAGKAKVKLRPLQHKPEETGTQEKSEIVAAGDEHADRSRAQAPPTGSDAQEVEAEVVKTAVQNQEDRDKKFLEAFDDFCPSERIVLAFVEGLEANMVVWEAQEVEVEGKENPDGSPKTKTVNIPRMVPDHKTRIASARNLAEFKHGKPVERKEVVERKVFDESEFEKQLESPMYLNALKRKLEKAEAKLKEKEKDS